MRKLRTPLSAYPSRHGGIDIKEHGVLMLPIASARTQAVAYSILEACNDHEKLVDLIRRALPWLAKAAEDGAFHNCVGQSQVDHVLTEMQAVVHQDHHAESEEDDCEAGNIQEDEDNHLL